ncbi:biotin--acetyl-CoA-carboxylase ligase [Actinoplanes sp. SE50]|uniref:biotin--[acetyl-CoA-carboxylase] ligase n=1 Tax=unclassified Actinoplanes TaxID=2626549 RepID=UPI00023EDD42|nr:MULTISPECIES: biotin--[acetyl-CoA-carboxylase] ligase [unclassified Actinoplanes]AEV88596.1 BirA family transcriptional regulator, biotin operon repressor / biotin-[acetyl-CoA carboxylase] ligase [Actinoplanes sp. SE50/110]ATO87001.1 biotin--acetyl-CoA-carboxylase ligase [Actinoplanes sp. SE50]SLM04419.1 biotin--[acetyl-CoA-carboxylase] ligase [Actinoplanes sp. SE50/110]
MAYTDLDRPPLSERALTRALVQPGALWSRIEVRPETGSTNADATEAARAGAAEGLVVVAERQVAGRGRRDRQWLSPARAGLTLSVLLRPGTADQERGWPAAGPGAFGWLPLLAGVALADAVSRVTTVDATLKWPNDLLAGDRKCAGILAEMAGDAIVVGIGLNVSTRAEELPATTGVPATSLRLAGAENPDRDPLLRALLRSVERWYAGWREAGGDAEMCGLLGEYRRRCATIGRDVRVLLPGGGELLGEATTVDRDGQLVIRSVDGAEHRVSAGDVLHVR